MFTLQPVISSADPDPSHMEESTNNGNKNDVRTRDSDEQASSNCELHGILSAY